MVPAKAELAALKRNQTKNSSLLCLGRYTIFLKRGCQRGCGLRGCCTLLWCDFFGVRAGGGFGRDGFDLGCREAVS